MCTFLNRWVGLVLGWAALAGCSSPPPGAPTPKPITYGELAAAPIAPADARLSYGADSLTFGDLRLPDGVGSVPLVVLIHGGCWLAEYNLDHVSQAAAALTRAGFATWTVEYRRVGNVGGGWPGTFVDIARSVDFVRTLAARYPRLDTNLVTLVGHSAGGQLALWAASRQSGETLDGVPVASAPLRVRGVVSLAGITDLRRYGAMEGSCNSAVPQLLGGTAAQQSARYAAVSPVERAPFGVALRLVHGAADPIVPVAQSQALLDVVGGGADARLILIPEVGHFDLVAPQTIAWPSVVGGVRSLLDTL